jgi:hypothetical protein
LLPFPVSCLTTLSGPAYDLGWGSQAPKAGPDDSMSSHEDTVTYDLGWGSVTPATPSVPTAVLETSVDDDPVYDLGWGHASLADALAPTAVPETSVDDDTVYDLGWGHASSADALAPTAQPNAELSVHEDDDPAFDLGWDVQITAPKVGMESGDLGNARDDSPAYDLGWGNEHPEEEPMDKDVVVIKSEAEEDIVDDVTRSNGEPSHPEVITAIDVLLDVIDLTCSTSPEHIRACRLSPAVTKPESTLGDEESMFQANRWLKTIGNSMCESSRPPAIVYNT